jgi:hypothetical protein
MTILDDVLRMMREAAVSSADVRWCGSAPQWAGEGPPAGWLGTWEDFVALTRRMPDYSCSAFVVVGPDWWITFSTDGPEFHRLPQPPGLCFPLGDFGRARIQYPINAYLSVESK